MRRVLSIELSHILSDDDTAAPVVDLDSLPRHERCEGLRFEHFFASDPGEKLIFTRFRDVLVELQAHPSTRGC